MSEFSARADAVPTVIGRARPQSSLLAPVVDLRLDCPAPSRWDAEHRDAFINAIRERAADPAVRAIVLKGRRLFSDPAGVPPLLSQKDLAEVYAAVAEAGVPVIAVISGPCTGSGLDLALACAARFAAPAATFGDLDAGSGRLPSYRSLARLTALVGLEQAAELCVFDATWDADQAKASGLVDALSPRNLPAMIDKVGEAARLRRTRAVAPEVIAAQLYGIRVRIRREAPQREAPLICLRALECATQMPPRRAVVELEQLQATYGQALEAKALTYAARGAVLLRRRAPGADVASELLWPLMREAIHLLDEGATPAQLDRAFIRFGFQEGPFAASDRRGLAVVFGRHGALATSEDWCTYSPTLDLLADTGRTGGAGGRGWFRHGPNGRNGFEPEVWDLLQASATFQRLQRRQLPDDLVSERCLYAAMNGAAHLLEARPDLSAEVLDAIWLRDLGFPRWRGGPLFMARTDAAQAVTALSAWAKQRITAGAPSDLLRRLAVQQARTD